MKRLFGWIKPDFYYESVFDIELDKLRNRGIRNLLIDLDNTLVPWGKHNIDSRLTQWFSNLATEGFDSCILSNNTEERADYLCGIFGLPYIAFAKKPSRQAFRKGLSKLNAAGDQTAVIGDQIFTDVLGGKMSGLTTILVVPLSRSEFWGTKIARIVERFILKVLYGKSKLPIKSL